MSKVSFPSHPLLLGFEHLERLVERTARSGADGYPPFNIEVTGQHRFRITLALAGFHEDDLSITLEGRQLVIRGQQVETGSENRVFLHRGIATRQFQRVFALGDGMDIAKAVLSDGLLHIDLRRHEPEETIQTIHIDRK